MVKLKCGKCDQLDLDHPVYRYGEPFYPCKRYFKNVGTKENPKLNYKKRKAHDECLLNPEMKKHIQKVGQKVREEIEVAKKKRVGRPPKKKKKTLPEKIKSIEETVKVGGFEPLKELEYIPPSELPDIPMPPEEFVPPDPIEEIIEPIPLTPEEIKAIKRQALEAQIAELEAEE